MVGTLISIQLRDRTRQLTPETSTIKTALMPQRYLSFEHTQTLNSFHHSVFSTLETSHSRQHVWSWCINSQSYNVRPVSRDISDLFDTYIHRSYIDTSLLSPGDLANLTFARVVGGHSNVIFQSIGSPALLKSNSFAWEQAYQIGATETFTGGVRVSCPLERVS